MMMQPDESSWPAEWTNRSRSAMAVFGAIFLGLLTAAAAAAAIWQLITGEALTAVILGGIAVYFGHIVGLGVRGLVGGRPRAGVVGVRPGPGGLTFRYAAAPTYWLTATMTLTVVVLAGLTVLAAAQGGTRGYVMAAVLAVAAVLAGVFLVVLLRLAPGQVVVSPEGIHHRGLTFTHDVPWHAVGDVVAGWANGPLVVIKTMPSSDTVTRNYLGRSGAGRQQLSPFATISGSWLAADPALLLRAVAYYLLHPDHRAELRTDAALRRVIG